MRKYENVNLRKLKPYKNNARTHSKEQIEKIALSIKEFGFINPILIDEKYGIIAGHGRVLGAKQLGIEKVPCLFIEDLTEEQKRAYILADNKLALDAGWDDKILKEEIKALDELNFDISLTGFELSDFDFNQTEIKFEEDDYNTPENLPTIPKSKYGDIYKLGNHRLMCGDSTKREDVQKLMNSNKADMVFTDPPYGYCYQSNRRINSKKFDILKNDDTTLDFFPIIKKFCNGFVFTCTTWKALNKWLPLFEKYYTLSNMIIWNKGGGGIGDLRHTFSTDYEIILCSNNGKKLTGSRLGSVWNIPRNNPAEYVHATQKPIKLAATAIENTTNRNELVLDLFGGSGSTLIACEQLNRKCYMMELDSKYVDVIIDRWEKFTGKKAVKIND